jgi:nitrogen fixation NifU-like protein
LSAPRDLYPEAILEHARKPLNFRQLEGANRRAAGVNPLCGDEITVSLKLAGEVIEEIGFQGAGCAISLASASMMTEAVKRGTRAQAESLFQRVEAMLAGSGASPELGGMAALSPVSRFPARVKCATLAWHALRAALEGAGEPVSTE